MAEPEPLTLAVVDDDDDVRRALARLLRAMGHEVRMFRSAEDFESDPGAVDCAIVDLRMPGVGGLDLRERLRKRIVPVPIVLITGDLDRADAASATDTPLVTKPFDDVALAAAISKAISLADAARDDHAH